MFTGIFSLYGFLDTMQTRASVSVLLEDKLLRLELERWFGG